MEFRPDLVVLMNFLVEILLIAGTNRICGHKAAILRSAVAAAIGAAYAAGCLQSGFEFLGQWHWKIICSLVICFIAFGWERGSIRRSILLILLRLAMGSIAMGFGKGGFWAVVVAALSICLMCILGMDGRPGRQYLPITIVHREKTVQLTALVDTGNTLRDPISGLPVLVADAAAAWELLRLSKRELLHPVEALAAGGCSGLRLIPYNAVGQERGMLLGLRVEHLVINGRETEMIVAFAPHPIGAGGKFRALAGGHLI